jgi:hypothetical protein
MAEPTRDQPEPAPIRRRNGWFSWVILFLVGTASLSLAAVYLPPRIKMLGLFAIADGLLAGWLAARLAAMFEVRSASRVIECGLVFLVIVGGQIGTAIESHRVFRAAEEQAIAANPKRAAALRMLQLVNLPDDAKSAQAVADARKTIGVNGTSFTDYLQFRVSELGIRSRRLAIAIWVLEIVLGSLAGTWIFRRLAAAERLDASEPPAKLEE